MRAIILAGGKGSRLKPFTTLIPKPLVPLGGEVAILEIVIKQLRQNGFTHITLAINHFANLIRSFIGDGSKWNVKIDYSLETEPLGTIGPLTLIPDLPENFLVMNSDVLCNLNYHDFFIKHLEKQSLISVSTCKRKSKIDFGVIQYNQSKYLTGFQEKPEDHFDVSMGIYGLHKSVIEKLPKGKQYGFDNLMIDSIKNNEPVNIHPFSGFWLDIGRPDDYEYADAHYQEIKETLKL
ncbi:MAG: nucleoside-diphosphate-sugar pyrophosphorylase [Chlamydiae bacterium CG10_big_fil_rev_8_21_14_0_10_42_34]|nr:MAG: nucleoside-diphosphate-sugar pyrophosphorylase [Chlamydiae bacterium CG10_big_fil_rev_8_21_14_0_10_42_34]